MTTNTNNTNTLNLSASIAADLDAAPAMPSITPTAMILEKVGDKRRLIFISVTDWTETNVQTGEVKAKSAVNFLDPKSNGVVFSMGAQLVRQMRQFVAGVAVEIELTELKPTKYGGSAKLKIYRVTPLAIQPYDLRAVFGFAPVVGLPAPSPDRQPDAAPADVSATVENAPTNAQEYDANQARNLVYGEAEPTIPF